MLITAKDIDCQKRLIKTFINSVFVYDDKVILTFNYSSDQRTITLNEINGGLQEGVRISPSDVHQRIIIILIQRNDGYFIQKTVFGEPSEEQNSLLLHPFQIVKLQP